MIFAGLRARAQQKRAAYTLYANAVRLARAKELYAQYRIPDTLDGRFDSIVLHLYLFRERLKHDAAQQILLSMNEALVDDMDRSLREMGVGDMGVGKRVKAMGSALLGRMRAYEEAQDAARFAVALSRNVYRAEQGDAQALAEYVAELRVALDRIPTKALIAGELPAVSYPVSASKSDEALLRAAAR